MVKLTKQEKKMYQVFSLLMGYAIGANITTMKQISIYVSNSTKRLNVDTDCTIGFNNENNCYELLLKDGRKILFSRNSNEFGFKVLKEDNDMFMSVLVSERIPGDLTTTNVYGEIKIRDNGMYVIGFRPKDMSDNTSKFAYINYYTDDEIDWVYEITRANIDDNFDVVAKKNLIYPASEENSFIVLPEDDNLFDCFSGILSNVICRIDLLYENVSVVKNSSILTKKVRKK